MREAQDDTWFLNVIACHLAHWLHPENEVYPPDRDEHGSAWAIYYGLLDYLLNGQVASTIYRVFHPEDPETACRIETALFGAGIPALEAIVCRLTKKMAVG